MASSAAGAEDLKCIISQSQAGDFVRYALDASAIVAITDIRGTIGYVNEKFCEISGYSADELVGANHRILRSGLHNRSFFRSMYREIARGRIWNGEICNRRKDGSLYWVDTTIVPYVNAGGKVESYTAIRFDVTRRKRAEDELRQSEERHKTLASVDPLTELPNRRRFQAFLCELIVREEDSNRKFYLALLDLDAFQQINESFGHAAGDELLQTIAQRLRAFSTDNLFIARLAGDEFGLILEGQSDAEAFKFFETVLAGIREPIAIGGAERPCSGSIGVAIYPEHAGDFSGLFKAADMALHHSKALGRDRFERFQPRLREHVEQRAKTLMEIQAGLAQDQFDIFYQPIVPTSANRPVSLEALMRWRHPARGLITPMDFSVAFEDPSMRAVLGVFMLERVFNNVIALRAEGTSIGRVGINLTNSDFRSDFFLDLFFRRCRETGISPTQFCVEVTEDMFLGRNQQKVYVGLQELHEAGVEVALDDFGTGYASLKHLQELPIDCLKIDRRFISNIIASSSDQAIVSGVIHIAHGLGKVVTAEGVETAEQLAALVTLGCDSYQGWYFGKATDIGSLPAAIGRIPPVPVHV